ncbi:hypothetical protein OG729_13325 [Streptomyces sp. NBC_00210]|uniref:hypothetical protein n=1 Tax=unclassified Streptomyces TaxID=2593676 RepID=UPI003247A4F4
MRRGSRLSLLVLLPLALAGCGSQVAGDSDSRGGDGTGSTNGPVPEHSALEARARALQTLPEHVYVTRSDGFELARQSVGVIGGDGFSATYVSKTGGQITLAVDRGTVDAANCAAIPMGSATGADGPSGAACAKDGKGWYRTSDSGHEYVRTENGLRIQISAGTQVERDVLRKAAEAAHLADDRELDEVLPQAEDIGGQTPVERGDLPPAGDGAPNNEVGVSG